MRSRSQLRRRRRHLLALALPLEARAPHEQQPRPRLDWDLEVERLLHEGEFKRTYRMTPASFNRLCGWLAREDRPAHAWLNRSPVSVENKLQMTLRFLCGGMVDDFRRLRGVDRSYCYRIVKDVVLAIVEIPELQICFPTTPTQREVAAAGFAARSNERVMSGCIAAMDGWLCNIQAPSDADAGSAAGARRYFSGHYMHPGINVHACCDAFSRFVFVEATHPGGVNDSRAYVDSGLPTIVEHLERGIYIVADAAYTATNHLLTPFTALQPGELFKTPFRNRLGADQTSNVAMRVDWISCVLPIMTNQQSEFMGLFDWTNYSLCSELMFLKILNSGGHKIMLTHTLFE
ncbi:hypothetical protein PF008_g5761 [Phytophthora fragariae]|uniref:DDE Tnp4 domain-containing protein n=1 Tax=Phytophthora fragariae TaxID=53985 RepID=A0A6G0S821_9STRA|nr:hypothetical protein PF008_g5761 [Phytophthora fragariae]